MKVMQVIETIYKGYKGCRTDHKNFAGHEKHESQE